MKKLYTGILFFLMTFCAPILMKGAGWPANYEGVMLQGFYWDSYTDTKWTNLEAQADELSKYFKLIWVPNSGKASNSTSMGYDPVYWFTNHNSSFGTEAEIRSLIKTYKSKGVGIIEDVVVNHRNGATDWHDFPAETWNGTTWHLTTGSICSTDEVWSQRPSTPTSYKGAPDTGEDFNGCRDLDHTNANVQNNVKNYCKFLLEDMGYAGFRLDMVKGYSGQYTKIYNEYSKPQFCVGEYWDGEYDGVAGWIEATGRQSAAFDFPCKYRINTAFANNDMRELVWYANGTKPQPAGLIHFGYQQYSVTFVDNHDTYRDGSKFTSDNNVVAANAFILCSPGTPCVFLPHYKQHKAEIQKLILIRNEVGVHNMSEVKVLQTSSDCYMAEVTGKYGKLVVKIGSAMVSPSGYTDSQIKASGTNYCVWTTTSGGVNPPTPSDQPFTVYFDNSSSNWTTPHIHYWGGTESTWPGVAMTKVKDNVWSYSVPAGTTGCLFNAGDGDPTKTADFVAQANHIYTTSGDRGVYSDAGNNGNYPSTVYMMGHVDGFAWASNKGLAASGNNGSYVYNNVTVNDGENGYGFFSFASKLSATDGDWDGVNSGARYGATAADELISVGIPATVRTFQVNVDASSCYSWKLEAGTYNITLNLANSTVTVSKPGNGVNHVELDTNAPVEYFNLQGVKVDEPTQGIYIRRQGDKVSKIIIL